MKTEHVACFQAIKKYQNLTEAADSLFITPPTLSKQLKSLESELGGALFDRSRSPVVLTPLGRLVEPYMERIMNEYKGMLRAAANVTGLNHMKLTVAVFIDVPLVLNRLLASFESHVNSFQSGFHVESHECSLEERVRMLRSGEADVSLGYLELFRMEEGFEATELRKDKLVLIANRDHTELPGPTVSMKSLCNERFYIPREDVGLCTLFQQMCVRAGFEPELTMSKVRLGTTREYVAANMRLTVQTETRAKTFFNDPIFRTLEIEDSPPLTMAVITNRRFASPMTEAFIHFAKQSLRF